jgi:hypothetical protein
VFSRRKLKALLAESITSEPPVASPPDGSVAPPAVEPAQAAAAVPPASPDASLEKQGEDGGTESPDAPSDVLSSEAPDSSDHEPMRAASPSLPSGGQGAERPARRRRTPVGGSR